MMRTTTWMDGCCKKKVKAMNPTPQIPIQAACMYACVAIPKALLRNHQGEGSRSCLIKELNLLMITVIAMYKLT
jgi:hypothetical protein